MPDLVIRPAVQDDLEVLWDFLAMAAYEPHAEAAKAVPFVAKYLVGWQRPGDFGFIAEQHGEIGGAAGARRGPSPQGHIATARAGGSPTGRMACNSRRRSCVSCLPRRWKASRSTSAPGWSKASARTLPASW